MKFNRLILIIIAVLSAITASGFYYTINHAARKTAVLWTDRPELISVVETYNSIQDDFKVKIVYTPNPAIDTARAVKFPDIVIGSYLNSPDVVDNFRRIDSIFKQDKLEKNSFYPELLLQGTKKEKQYLLPVSFKLPALMFRRGDVSQAVSSFTLSSDNITSISKEFLELNNKEKSNTVSPFSPRWNSEMIYYSSVMNNAEFRVNENNILVWDNESLEQTLQKTRAFIREINGGFEKEKMFQEKYLYRPVENLIIDRRIFFAYTDLGTFYSISQEKRNNLNFRWMAETGKIPVCDDIIYAGIPRQAYNKKGAELFFIWFFNHETQEYLIEAARSKRIRSFGISGGFSSVRSVNEQIFPRHYPLLVGHIPPPEVLSFPGPLPAEWEMLKNDVIKKWLYTESGKEKTESSLNAALIDWYNLHPEF